MCSEWDGFVFSTAYPGGHDLTFLHPNRPPSINRRSEMGPAYRASCLSSAPHSSPARLVASSVRACISSEYSRPLDCTTVRAESCGWILRLPPPTTCLPHSVFEYADAIFEMTTRKLERGLRDSNCIACMQGSSLRCCSAVAAVHCSTKSPKS